MPAYIKKSACADLQKKIITSLSALKSSLNINVYDNVPEEQVTYPFVVVRDMSERPWGDKTQLGHAITVSVESFIQDKTSLTVKELNSKIIEILDLDFPFNYKGMPGYEIVYCTLDNNTITQMGNSVYLGTINCTFYMIEIPIQRQENA